MNAELSPFKNGKHTSEGASTLDRDITTFIKIDSRFIGLSEKMQ